MQFIIIRQIYNRRGLTAAGFEGYSETHILNVYYIVQLYHIVTCQVHPVLVKRVQCTVRSSFLIFWVVLLVSFI